MPVEWVEFDNGRIKLALGDCLDVLPTLEAGSVPACVTDPQYGIDWDNTGGMTESGGWTQHEKLGWDAERPPKEAFAEILRVSRQQIIWGGNYFTDYLPPTMQWLVWDKGQRDFSLADCEFAWSSQYRGARILNLARATANKEPRLHPTQKPTPLIVWCIEQLKPEPETILDPFMGSGTTGIACIRLGRKFLGIEREPKYFDIAVRRIEAELRQPRLFPAAAPVETQRSFLEPTHD